jgi:hypothetical protein
MSDEEVADFLGEHRTVICASAGRDGWPHLMPLWYLVRENEIWSWTYARSQKVRNLERDDRCTLAVESGTEYAELCGVMLRTRAVIRRDVEDVTAFGLALFRRYTGVGDGELAPEVEHAVRAQAPKRVVLQFVEAGPRATWDHRKLGGTY